MVDNRTNDFEIFINDILDNTGKIALKYFRDIKDLSLKRDMSPVTKADKEIEKYIRTQILIITQITILLEKNIKRLLVQKISLGTLILLMALGAF